jgi:hypothetical protein
VVCRDAFAKSLHLQAFLLSGADAMIPVEPAVSLSGAAGSFFFAGLSTAGAAEDDEP